MQKVVLSISLVIFVCSTAASAFTAYPLTFRFKVDGMPKVDFTQLTGVGIDFEEVSGAPSEEGGLMQSKKGSSKVRDVVLGRKFNGDPALFNWAKDQQKSKVVKTKNATLEIVDASEKVIARFNFTKVWPKSWSAPTLSVGTDRFGEPSEELVLSVADFDLQ